MIWLIIGFLLALANSFLFSIQVAEGDVVFAIISAIGFACACVVIRNGVEKVF